REAPALNELLGRTENSRIAWLIKVQATRIVARPHSESREAHALGIDSLLREKVQRLPAFLRVWVVIKRQQRFGKKWKPSAARLQIRASISGIPLERIDCNDDKRR